MCVPGPVSPFWRALMTGLWWPGGDGPRRGWQTEGLARGGDHSHGRGSDLLPLPKTVLRQASAWDRFWRDFLELQVWGGSEANFLELCFGRFLYGNFHTKAASKKFRPPSGNFRPNPPELPRSPSRSGSSEEAGGKSSYCPLFPGQADTSFRRASRANPSCQPLVGPLQTADFQSSSWFANPPASYRSLSGPPGPKPPKSLKKVSRGLWPRGPQKSGKSLEKVRKSLEKVCSGLFRDFFPDFFQSRRFRETFSDFLGISGREGPRDSCSSSEGSQFLVDISAPKKNI